MPLEIEVCGHHFRLERSGGGAGQSPAWRPLTFSPAGSLAQGRYGELEIERCSSHPSCMPPATSFYSSSPCAWHAASTVSPSHPRSSKKTPTSHTFPPPLKSSPQETLPCLLNALERPHARGVGRHFFFFFTLVTGPRRSLSLKLSDTRVYEPQIRARLGTTAHFCEVVVLKLRAVGLRVLVARNSARSQRSAWLVWRAQVHPSVITTIPHQILLCPYQAILRPQARLLL